MGAIITGCGLTPSLPKEFCDKLRDYQVEPARHLLGLLRDRINCVNLSDTGTGKTYVAMAAALASRRPTLVVAPKISRSTWEGVAEFFGEKVSVINYEMLRTGRSPYGHWDNTPPPGNKLETYLVCENCQQRVDLKNFRACYTHSAGIHCVTTKKLPWNYGRFHYHPGVRQIIFDEAHRCGSRDSLNADLMIAAAQARIPTMALSATAACSPLQLRALGYLLGLHNLGDFYAWAGRYGCRRDLRFRGYKWLVGRDRQIEIMADIRRQLIPSRGVRVSIAEIPGFPACEISAKLYDLAEHEAVNKAYASMIEPLAKVDRMAANDQDPSNPLTKILRARQKIELLKTPIAIELAQDYLEKGYSVAIFCNYRQTIEELSKRLDCDVIVDGSPEGSRNRDYNINRFQVNDSRLILLNNMAGDVSLSLHDLDGNFPRVGLVFPPPSAISLRQIFGRLPRDGGKSVAHYRVMFAAKTFEVQSHHALASKLNCLDALNDEDMMPQNLHLC